ncbi:MAG: hypothetical protein KJ638_02680 [Chloroflexi bacterium]|nr:hypothetical protein [Chloroflexota bacterium]
MKMTKIRGIRDIPTIQGLRNQAVPKTREQTVATLARLEHEKARLIREMSVWTRKLEQTKSQLQHVQERIDGLQHILHPLAVDKAPKPAKTRLAAVRETNDDQDKSQSWQEVSLEY